ncbi:hypothetical protein T492DRAFT_1130335 [Pavlovales sp. CCMP2436]|nr:hypothetical protein T492DRAFT_1130335 [Pavlovales sp. CCMP2436]
MAPSLNVPPVYVTTSAPSSSSLSQAEPSAPVTPVRGSRKSPVVKVDPITSSEPSSSSRAGPSFIEPVRGSQKSPAVKANPVKTPDVVNPQEVMTITGVPLIQSNPHSSPFITGDDPSGARAMAQADLITAQNDQNEVEHLRSQAPAWIERQRASVSKVDLLAVPDISKFIDESQLEYRASFLANAQIPANKYPHVFIKTLVRNMVMVEFYTQKSRQLVEEEALLKISKVFKGSKQAATIEQKRIDDVAATAAKRKPTAAEARKKRREEVGALKLISDSMAGVSARRGKRATPAP